MQTTNRSWHAPTLQSLLVFGNLCVWVYFWLSFIKASYPYQPDPLGHPSGSGYTFWGHSIAVSESPFAHHFFELVFWADFPTFAVVMLPVFALTTRLGLDGFFGGISLSGWVLLAVMLLSFLQWYLIGVSAVRVWRTVRGLVKGV